MTRPATRIGAVMFLVSVAVAGPSAIGVASADPTGADQSANSAPHADSPRRDSGISRPARTAAVADTRGSDAADRPVVNPRRAATTALPVAATVRQPRPPRLPEEGPPASSSPLSDASAVRSAATVAIGPGRPLAVPGAAEINPAGITSSATSPVVETAAATVGLPVYRGPRPTAAAITTSGTPTPALVTRKPLESVATVQTVRGFLGSVTTWLSDLPAGPITDFLQGALLLIRRTLFNEAPAAKPPPVSGPMNDPIAGSLDAFDPEGDRIVYTLAVAPRHGSVTLSTDGTYAYVPDPGFTGIDSFTVSVRDTGWHINLLQPFLPVPADAVVTVAVGDIPPRVTLGDPYDSYAPPEGCSCQQVWSYNGVIITGGRCANPDNDPNGPWCRLGSSPDGRSWSYCSARSE